MPKRVYITEKPSVGRALAEHLGIKKGYEGYIEVAGGDVVTWQIGHLLEQAGPDHYLPADKKGKWEMGTLPIIPSNWVKFPKSETDPRGAPVLKNGKPIPSKQLAVVVEQIKKADIIVNAGDIDKEGQLVADEVIEYAGFPPDGSKKPVERVLLVALDPDSLSKALANKRRNGEPEFVNRRLAAVGRSQADWLLGMNGTRAMTCKRPGQGVTSVGRVQTPTLGIVVKRDLEIEGFKPKDYFVPFIQIREGQATRELLWQERLPGKSEEGLDETGRIIDRRLAEKIVENIRKSMQGQVENYTAKEVKDPPPLPYNLSALQIDMSKAYGFSANDVSKIAQNLYERHKMISYIGTDSRYLPESMHADGPAVLTKLSKMFGGKVMEGVQSAIKHACWNDAKVSAHHAIVPTGITTGSLGPEEKKVFDAIARRYIAQFHPHYVYRAHSLAGSFGEDRFGATWQEPLVLGWRAVNGDMAERPKVPGMADAEEEEVIDDKKDVEAQDKDKDRGRR